MTEKLAQNIMLASGKFKQEEAYWLEKLAGDLTLSLFPLDRPYTRKNSGRECSVRVPLPEEISRKILHMSGNSDFGVYMFLLTGVIYLLHTYTGNQDIIVGSPVFTQQVQGTFLNRFLALRTEISEGDSFKDLLLQVKQTITEANEHMNYPLEKLIELLQIPGSAGPVPLFDTMLVFNNIHELQGILEAGSSIIFQFDRTPGGLEGVIRYNDALFFESSIQRFSRHLINYLQAVTTNPQIALHEINLLSEEELKQVTVLFNRTEADYQRDKLIHQLFEEQVEKHPDAIAIHAGDTALTYGEMNTRANQLARRLQKRGVGPEQIVGILVERSLEMMIGIYAILKAGGAYLPISVEYPDDRINYMLTDSGAKVLLTKSVYAAKAGFQGEVLLLEDSSLYVGDGSNLEIAIPTALETSTKSSAATGIEAGSVSSAAAGVEAGSASSTATGIEAGSASSTAAGVEASSVSSPGVQSAQSLAYVIYTSGSTGNPKGVMIEHHSVVNRLNWMQNSYPLRENDLILQKTPYTFDVSVWELFWWSMYGAQVGLVRPGGEKDPAELCRTIEKCQVTVMHFVPSMLNAFLEHVENGGAVVLGKLHSLKRVICSGEALSVQQAQRFYRLFDPARVQLVNLYGPTEATVDVSYFNCSPEDLDVVPIGKPIDNIQLYILDKTMHPLPLGVAGELCISGVGLARGYLNRPELTREKFISHPLLPNARLYRTGDLARWLPDGNIEYLGRIDNQVKIRGFRIELGEIEQALAGYPGIKDVVVIDRLDQAGDKYLAAYIVVEKDLTVAQLKGFLAEKLPEYMIPTYFIKLESIPLTLNGKVNRRALPEPDASIQVGSEYVPAGTDTESALVEIWEKCLQRNRVGIRDNFFDLGGDSIKAVKLVSLINQTFNCQLELVDIYEQINIENLARSLTFESNVQKNEGDEEILEVQQSILADLDQAALLPADLEDFYPMSDIEKGMVYYSLVSPEGGVYHDQFIYQITDPDWSVETLTQALALLAKKHANLRTSYHFYKFSLPLRIVHTETPLDIMTVDLSDLSESEQEMHIKAYLADDRKRPFDLEQAPLWRMRIFSLPEDVFCIVWIFHHAMLDGWSVASFMTELTNLYFALKANPLYRPEALQHDYKDFIRDQILVKKNTEIVDYWQRELADYKRLKLTKEALHLEQAALKTETFSLNPQLLTELQALASRYKTSLKSVFFTGYTVMLRMLAYESDIVVGLVEHNRPVCQDSEKILGCFLNTIPVRVRFAELTNWEDLLLKIDQKLVEVKHYGRLPLLEIARVIGENTYGENPVFDTYFNYIDFHVYEELNQSKLVQKQLELEDYERTNIPLNFTLFNSGGQIWVKMIYPETVFSAPETMKLFRYFTNALQQFGVNPSAEIRKDVLLLPEEKEELLYAFNATEVAYRKDWTIHRVFEAQAAHTPERTALICGENSLTYGEYNARANRLARLLRQKGIKPDHIVGIMLGRSLEMMIGIMAILKAGGAYLPIQPDYPTERINYMLQDSQTQILLTDSKSTRELAFSGEMICLDELSLLAGDTASCAQCAVEESSGHSLLANTLSISCTQPTDDQSLSYTQSTDDQSSSPDNLNDDQSANSGNLAYIIYTSGSTGAPKGAMIEHHSVINRLEWMQKRYPLDADDLILQKTSISFDVSVWELFWWSMYGAKLCLLPQGGEKDPETIVETIEKNKVTVMHFVPSMLNAFLEYIEGVIDLKRLGSLKQVFCSGEALGLLQASRFNRLFPKTALANLYGPTEATVDVSYFDCTNVEKLDCIPIGRPIDNIQLYILDEAANLQPIGTPGELCIAGVGLARGYWNRPALTGEKFVQNPFAPGQKMYKTGDLATWLPNGQIKYLGRIDNQIKIRGFRIELGEIEKCLQKHPAIREAVVIDQVNAQGDKYLSAYLVCAQELSVADLRRYLAGELPEYMIPAYFVKLERIPLTPNGKVNRQALQALSTYESTTEYVAPTTEHEEKLVQIWKKVLERSAIGVMDNFFELGGDSIKALRLVSAINQSLEISMHIVTLYKNPTIFALAKEIAQNSFAFSVLEKQAVVAEVEQLKKEILAHDTLREQLSADWVDLYPMSDIEKGMIYHSLANPEKAVYHDQFVYQITDPTFDLSALEQALSMMVEKHSILRTSFNLLDFDIPVQIVHQNIANRVEVLDLNQLQPEEQEIYLKNYLRDDRARPFIFTKPGLWRMRVIQLGAGSLVLLWIFHHAILDGWSVASLMTELINLYFPLKDGRDIKLEPLHNDYKTFVLDQMLVQRKPEIREFWREELADYKRLTLPANPVTAEDKEEIQTIIQPLDEALLSALEGLAAKWKTTVKTLCFTAYVYLLNMFSFENDLVVGLVEHNRPVCQDGDRILGCFLNTLPVRIAVGEVKTWQGLVQELEDKLIELKLYGRLSLLEIMKTIGESSSTDNPLFDTHFNYIDFHILHQVEAKDALVTNLSLENYERTNTLLNFTILHTAGQFTLRLAYVKKAFGAEQVSNFLRYFTTILSQMALEPTGQMRKDHILSPEEKQFLLGQFVAQRTAVPPEKTVRQLFLEQALRTPDQIAVEYIWQKLTYRELKERATQLAKILRGNGVKPGEVVALLCERSLEMIIAIFGTLLAGGAYLPIDPQYPVERIRYILEDSQARMVLTHGHLTKTLPLPCQVLELTQDLLDAESANDQSEGLALPDLSEVNTGHDLTYVIYTSGTTGKPKGVMIEDHNLANLVYSLNERIYQPYARSLNVALVSPYFFDASVKQIFPALLHGHKLCIVPEEMRFDGAGLCGFYREKAIDVADGTPMHLKLIVHALGQSGEMLDVKHFVIGGEELPPALVGELLGKCRDAQVVVTNVYGPTECTDVTTLHSLTKENDLELITVPIGKPIDNAKVYILDNNQDLLPPGVPGELWIAGAGVGRGYLGKEQLTREKFTQNPFDLQGRMYRSGDLVRWLGDGNLEFMGRIDNQVKLRGFRIELHEIEQCLLRHEAISDALVVLVKDETEHTYLAAYYVSTEELEGGELRGYLAQSLPDYMLPAYYVRLERMLLTPNGKIDRRALPRPTVKFAEDSTYIPARNELEARLVEVWQKVLGVEQMGILDNFFSLGGDSIKAIQIAARLRKYQYKLEIKHLFQNPTIAEVSKHVQKLERQAEQGVVEGYLGLTPIQSEFFFWQTAARRQWNQAVMLESATGFDAGLLRKVVSHLVQHHDALRMVYPLENGEVRQYNRALEGEHFTLEEFDLRRRVEPGAEIPGSIGVANPDSTIAGVENNCHNKLELLIDKLQRSINLTEGPLLKLGLLKTDQGDHLLIIIHHLVVDGISWRIILEDLALGYQQALHLEEIVFSLKTDSFKRWSEELHRFARQPKLLRQIPYWKQVLATPQAFLLKESPTVANQIRYSLTQSLRLSKVETGQLLREVHQAYNTEINDILLTALGLALREWQGLETVVVNLEGHGREEIVDADVTRTVGWFTSLAPVVLDVSTADDLATQIQMTKETLRRIPTKGIGYGILKYLTPKEQLAGLEFLLQPEIGFNYLGNFAENLLTGDLRFSKLSPGQGFDPEGYRKHSLDINGMVVNDQLTLDFTYNQHYFTEQSIARLLASYQRNLQKIIAHCRNRVSILTPSDVGCTRLSLAEFRGLKDHLREVVAQGTEMEKIYSLSPMQAGMLYHTLLDQTSNAYFEQMSFSIAGQLDIELFRKTWQMLMLRHDIFRTVFVCKNVPEPLQVILKNRPLEFAVLDISTLGTEEQQVQIADYLRVDQERGFDLTKDVLLRVRIFQTGAEDYRVIWSHHHIILDGWCLGIIMREFFQLYDALLHGVPLHLPAPVPFRHFIDWLEEQEREDGYHFWQKYVDGYPFHPILTSYADTAEPGQYRKEEMDFVFDETVTAALTQIARAHQVTLNTVFNVLWGVFLGKYFDTDDVIFGSVVSGRPSEIPGIEQMIGLFINTIPVRVSARDEDSFSFLLAQSQSAQVAVEKYSYLSIAELQTHLKLKKNLIDHVVIFENFPVQNAIEGIKEKIGFEITDLILTSQIDADFYVVVFPEARLGVRFGYNGFVYDGELVRKLGQLFYEVVQKFIRQINENPDLRVNQIELLAGEEKQKMLERIQQVHDEVEIEFNF